MESCWETGIGQAEKTSSTNAEGSTVWLLIDAYPNLLESLNSKPLGTHPCEALDEGRV